MPSKLGMTGRIMHGIILMLVSMTVTLMQGHSGQQRQTISFELFRQLGKEQALIKLATTVYYFFYVTLNLDIFI